MSSQLKRKYRQARREFKRDLFTAEKENHALAMLMVETYTAKQHRTHIMQIWSLLGHHHPEAYRNYCKKLMGKTITGRNEVWKSLHFAGYQELREKYMHKIPHACAMGDALAVAYRVLEKSA